MNYSKNIRKVAIGRRVLMLIACAAAVFFAIGIIIGAANAPDEVKETYIYGHYDGKIYEGEMPELKSGSEFVPLNVPLDTDLQEYIFYMSAAYDIDFPLVMALIQQETDFNAGVVSKTGDYGLMQINTVNHSYLADELGITDFLDPYQNVNGGLFILRKLFEKYETPEKVLMAYNMGESGAALLWEQGIFESNFSRNILKMQAEYTAEIERSKKND